MVHSIQNIHQQFKIVEEVQSLRDTPDGIKVQERLKREIESYQEFTLFDPILETQLRSTRALLREQKGDLAANKLRDLLYYAGSFEYRLAILEEDVTLLQDEIKADRQSKDVGQMNLHAEEAYYKL